MVKLEGCERLEAWISMGTGELRAFPNTCPVRLFPSRTDLELQAISYLMHYLTFPSDPGTAPRYPKDLIILKPILPNWPTSLPVSNE